MSQCTHFNVFTPALDADQSQKNFAHIVFSRNEVSRGENCSNNLNVEKNFFIISSSSDGNLGFESKANFTGNWVAGGNSGLSIDQKHAVDHFNPDTGIHKYIVEFDVNKPYTIHDNDSITLYVDGSNIMNDTGYISTFQMLKDCDIASI